MHLLQNSAWGGIHAHSIHSAHTNTGTQTQLSHNLKKEANVNLTWWEQLLGIPLGTFPSVACGSRMAFALPVWNATGRRLQHTLAWVVSRSRSDLAASPLKTGLTHTHTHIHNHTVPHHTLNLTWWERLMGIPLGTFPSVACGSRMAFALPVWNVTGRWLQHTLAWVVSRSRSDLVASPLKHTHTHTHTRPFLHKHAWILCNY